MSALHLHDSMIESLNDSTMDAMEEASSSHHSQRSEQRSTLADDSELQMASVSAPATTNVSRSSGAGSISGLANVTASSQTKPTLHVLAHYKESRKRADTGDAAVAASEILATPLEQLKANWILMAGCFLASCAGSCCVMEFYNRRKEEPPRRQGSKGQTLESPRGSSRCTTVVSGILDRGKKSRGADDDEKYRFGDATRGIINSWRGHGEDSP